MPFTIDGEWVPSKNSLTAPKPVKVRLVKRGKNMMTVILNLNMTKNQMTELASKLKKKLGCGGAIKEEGIEIQGDKVEEIKKSLSDIGIKSS